MSVGGATASSAGNNRMVGAGRPLISSRGDGDGDIDRDRDGDGDRDRDRDRDKYIDRDGDRYGDGDRDRDRDGEQRPVMQATTGWWEQAGL